MASVNYMKDEDVQHYYKIWELIPLLHGQDRNNFYKFVKACFRVDNKLNTDYLKLALYDSFHDKLDPKAYDEFCSEVVILFEHLRDFENTTLP